MCSTCARKLGPIQVAQAHGVRAADLVAVTGADAAAGGADVLAVGRALVERRSSAKCQGKITWARSLIRRVLAHACAARGQLVELLDHAGRIEHHAAGDDAGHAGRENAAGQQRELVDLVADDDGVPGVRPALIADDEVVLAGQQVDDLALGFVAPLQTDDASAGHGRDLMAGQEDRPRLGKRRHDTHRQPTDCKRHSPARTSSRDSGNSAVFACPVRFDSLKERLSDFQLKRHHDRRRLIEDRAQAIGLGGRCRPSPGEMRSSAGPMRTSFSASMSPNSDSKKFVGSGSTSIVTSASLSRPASCLASSIASCSVPSSSTRPFSLRLAAGVDAAAGQLAQLFDRHLAAFGGLVR